MRASTLIRRILPLAAAFVIMQVSAATTDPGIPQTLARERAKRISDVRYRFDLAIDPAVETVAGRMEIRFRLRERRIEHPLRLDWRPGAAGDATGDRIARVRINGAQYERPAAGGAFLLPRERLRPGENIVELDLRAPIRVSGGAITRYADREDGSQYVYTLFVPADASTVFPCFDQPDLKARFELALAVPAAWEAIANAPAADTTIEGETKRVRFAPSEPISTYLFAFAAGPFAGMRSADASDPTRLWVRRSQLARAKPEAEEVLRLNRESVRYFERYFDHRFPFPKYDLVLIPEFPYGGMEHAGATFLREDAVLFPTEPSAGDLTRRAQLVFHETSHQWFGNLVTMRWFDDLWLKEGFANFMAAKATAELLPDVDAWNAFNALKTSAYRTDATRGTTPIRQRLPDLSAAKSAYGNIVYSKGPAVLRQAEYFLGEAVFERAVRDFVRRHAYAAADRRDLVRAFERASGRNLARWAHAWVERRGLPVVRTHWRRDAAGRAAEFRIEQRDALGEGGPWPMRVELIVEGGDGSRRTESVMLSRTVTRVRALDGTPAPRFAFANHGDYGYGVFLADEASRTWLLEHLAEVREPFLRALLWAALWESVRAAELDPARYVELVLDKGAAERDPVTVAALLARLRAAMERYVAAGPRARLAPRVEAFLREGMAGDAPAAVRVVWFRTFVALARSDEARAELARYADGSAAPAGIPLRARDRFEIAAALIAAGDPQGAIRLEALAASDTSDDARRYAYAARAAAPDAAGKRALFRAWLEDATLPERWIEDSLETFNDPRHAALTRPLLPAALEALPALKRTRKIFFVNRWLAAFLGGQTGAAALAEVDAFLARPGLDPDLRLKVLEAMDALERTLAIHARYGAAP